MTEKIRTQEELIALMANFSHQIINPLNGALGTIDNIVKGRTRQENVQARLIQVKGQLKYIVDLMRNMKAFSDYTTSPRQYLAKDSRKTCIIPQIIVEALLFFQDLAKTREIRIHLDDDVENVACKGDPEILRQVIINLIDNAVKYGLEGSEININTWIKKGTETIYLTIEGVSESFDVNDDIFELGIRGSKAKKRVASGSGIGLYICRLIVEKIFEGKIKGEHFASSKMTLFTITINNGFIARGEE